jgi:predicted nucleotide-binding protein (sugar kinase/HSP70/actin superfamily)
MGTSNNVKIKLEEYNLLRDDNQMLKEANEDLGNQLDALKDAEGQKVIYKEVYLSEDEDEETRIYWDVKNLQEAKEEIEKAYGKTMKELEDKIKDLDEENMLVNKTLRKVLDEKLEAEMEVSRLKRRNLWKRILNK